MEIVIKNVTESRTPVVSCPSILAIAAGSQKKTQQKKEKGRAT